jgi:plasmid replication initiation protein
MPRKDEEKHSLQQSEVDRKVYKGRQMITAKYKASLLENKLTSIALSRLTMDGDTPVATLFPSEIKKLLGRQSDTNIYKKLISTAKTMTGHQMVIEDNNGNFEVLAMITNARYENGTFSVTFNKRIAPYIIGMKSNYTSYSLANVLRFKCDYSFRIYELIKSEAYHLKNDMNDVYVKDYGLSELKCMIGVVNMDEAKVKRAKLNGASWDEIVAIANEKSFNDWGDFRRRVLERARKELIEQCDVKFDYNPIAAGRGGKIVAVKFLISRNNPGEKVFEAISSRQKVVEETNDRYEQMSMFTLPERMEELVGHNGLSEKDVRAFMKEAAHNEAEVLRAVELADRQTAPLDNYAGWIISCIREHYEEPKVVVSGSKERGDRVAAASEILSHQTSTEKNAMSAAYWKKAMKKNSDNFQEFQRYLESRGVTMEMFTDANEEYECGDKFMQWIKGEEIQLF